ncbi:amidohydrolase family protein [[Mycobacterium] wendilense]|uniref:Amidohydrolase family protein n=1 Tax=[Mycobacterium] wendilense TaxID=3064284 RepID=A0ABN9P843_9MYCO|nr:amidohydrolase family protein [Mycolicibacterium sp. MU0050]CAJ1586199.1 amidohydrolase family protein [Mycolicibacterium sp. MU0050]
MDDIASVRQIWQQLELPGIVDVHTHFMPKSVMDKVWRYFDSAGPLTGREWPIRYRTAEEERVHTLRRFGVRAFSSLVYAHKPDMAEWLNGWAHQFALQTPDCLSTATFYPEAGAPAYVERAITQGAKLFKSHIQVGGYSPNDPLLDGVWAILQDSATPVVIHCGSGPAPGEFTGPEPIRELLRRFPRLVLVIAHMGMPEYVEFLDICAAHPQVRLDTTMAFTGFAEEMMPFPVDHLHRLHDLGERILFGSDFPNIPYSYADAMRALVKLGVGDDDWLRDVFYRNGARLFGLS